MCQAAREKSTKADRHSQWAPGLLLFPPDLMGTGLRAGCSMESPESKFKLQSLLFF